MTTPTFNFPNTDFSQSTAQGAFSLCGVFGASSDTCGGLASEAGMIMGTIQTPQMQNAYASASSSNTTATNSATGTTASQNWKDIGSCLLTSWTGSGYNDCMSKTQTGTGAATGILSSDGGSKILFIVAGFILLAAALYLFGTSSISSALESIK